MKNLNIVSFKKKYKADFEKLNREWIEEFFQMEDEDFYTLQTVSYTHLTLPTN